MIKSISSLLFFVKNLDKTLEFYKALGFNTKKDKGMVSVKVNWFLMNFIDADNSTFKKEFEAEKKGEGVFTYVKVVNVDKFYKNVLKKGIKPSSEPKDWGWGNREFVIKDPDGYKLVIFNKTS